MLVLPSQVAGRELFERELLERELLERELLQGDGNVAYRAVVSSIIDPRGSSCTHTLNVERDSLS